MSGPDEKALQSLRVLVARTEAALAAASAGAERTDALDECLGKRHAAFVNFRYYDQAAQASGSDLGRDPEGLALLQRLLDLEGQLGDLLVRLETDLERSLSRTRQHRLKQAQYHSGETGRPRLIRRA